MAVSQTLTVIVPETLTGARLDQALAQLLPDYSRARLQQWVRDGRVTVDGQARRPKDKVVVGETLVVNAVIEEETAWQAQDIPLDIVYEDADIIVLNKPAGLVVHPAAGNPDGTLLNALLHHAPELVRVPRAGIVHRLDKDTTGLLVIARTVVAQKYLVEAMQRRDIKRQYEAVACGVMTGGGTVEAPMSRHPVDRKRMAVIEGGKPAVTHYRVVERFRAHTHIRVDLETGRTHQIRVHLAHIRYPLLGDPVYGPRLRLPPGSSERLIAALRGFQRQALHAARLGLHHPISGAWLEWSVPLPQDMAELIHLLREDAREHGSD